jgi:hypothetical protein
MADIGVNSIIESYCRRLYYKSHVPSTAFGRATLGANGVVNKSFVAFLLSYPDFGVHSLKHVGLIRSNMVCCDCGSQMSWCVDTNGKDGYRWRCRRITSASASIRHCSWFQQSNHNFTHVLFFMYIVRSYEYDQEYVAACEGNPHFLQPDRDVYHLAHYIFAAKGGVGTHRVDQFTKFTGILARMDWSVSCASPRMTSHVYALCCARHTPLKFRFTVQIRKEFNILSINLDL